MNFFLLHKNLYEQEHLQCLFLCIGTQLRQLLNSFYLFLENKVREGFATVVIIHHGRKGCYGFSSHFILRSCGAILWKTFKFVMVYHTFVSFEMND